MAKTNENPSWPVILHQSMVQGDLAVILKQKQLKLRISDSVVPGSIIFPQSGVAFMVVPLEKVAVKDDTTGCLQITSELKERFYEASTQLLIFYGNKLTNDINYGLELDSFLQIHKKCYVLCMAPLHGDNEKQIFSLIQRQYIDTRLGMLPVHSANEAVKSMLTIAKSLCKPTSEVLSERLQTVVKEQLGTNYMATALKQVGLTLHEIQVIEDGLGSLSKLAMATEEELLDCSLDSSTVNKLCAFFSDH